MKLLLMGPARRGIRAPADDPPAPDVTPPAVPTGLAAGTPTTTMLALTWDMHPNTDGDLAAIRAYYTTDNTAVTTTDSFQAFAAASTGGSLIGLPSSTLIRVALAAIDTTGNLSALSAEVSETTEDPGEFVTFDIPGHEAILGPLTYAEDGLVQTATQPWPWYDKNQEEVYDPYGAAIPEGIPVTLYTGKVSVTNGGTTLTGSGTAFTTELLEGMFFWPAVPYTGTVSVTNGNATVTGTGTLFTSEFNRFQDHEIHIEINGVLYSQKMSSNPASDTSHDLAQVWAGPTASGVIAYRGRGAATGNVANAYANGQNATVTSDTEIELSEVWPHASVTDVWLLGDVVRSSKSLSFDYSKWPMNAYDGVRCLHNAYWRTGEAKYLDYARKAARFQIMLNQQWSTGLVLSQSHDGIHLYALDLDHQGAQHSLWDTCYNQLGGNNELVDTWLTSKKDNFKISSPRDQGYVMRWAMNLVNVLPDSYQTEAGGTVSDGATKRAALLQAVEDFIVDGVLRWQFADGMWRWTMSSAAGHRGVFSNLFHIGILMEGVIAYHRYIADDGSKADIYSDIKDSIYLYLDTIFDIAHREEGTAHAKFDNAIESDPYIRAPWVEYFGSSLDSVDQLGTISLTNSSTAVTGSGSNFLREFGNSNGATPIFPWKVLTGTVSFDDASPTILTGSGTAFTTELTAGQVVFLDYPHATQTNNRLAFKVGVVDNDAQVTLTEASPHDSISGATARYVVRDNKAGTVAFTDTTITGTGTSFLTDYEVGGVISFETRINASTYAWYTRPITAVNSDTEIIVSGNSHPDTTLAHHGNNYDAAYTVASAASDESLTLAQTYAGGSLSGTGWRKAAGGAMTKGGSAKIDASRQNNDEYVYVYAYGYKLAVADGDSARAARYRAYFEEVMGASFGETTGLLNDGETSLAWNIGAGGSYGLLDGWNPNQSYRHTGLGLAWYNGA